MEKDIIAKTLSELDLEPRGDDHSRNQKKITMGKTWHLNKS